jgi:hypothetical protein
LGYFLNQPFEKGEVGLPNELLSTFADLDDYDIFASAKQWMNHQDPILSELSSKLIHRKLQKIRLNSTPFSPETVEELSNRWQQRGYTAEQARFFVFTGVISNSAYKEGVEKINIFLKNGQVIDIRHASEQLGLSVLTESTRKYFLCYPKELDA